MSAPRRPTKFVVLVYRMPAKPTAGRVAVWRLLKKAGAVYLQDSVCVFPDLPRIRRELQPVLERIDEKQGSFHLLPLRSLTAEEEAKIVALFREQTSKHYLEIVAHALDGVPDEACGLLAAPTGGDTGAIAAKSVGISTTIGRLGLTAVVSSLVERNPIEGTEANANVEPWGAGADTVATRSPCRPSSSGTSAASTTAKLKRSRSTTARRSTGAR